MPDRWIESLIHLSIVELARGDRGLISVKFAKSSSRRASSGGRCVQWGIMNASAHCCRHWKIDAQRWTKYKHPRRGAAERWRRYRRPAAWSTVVKSGKVYGYSLPPSTWTQPHYSYPAVPLTQSSVEQINVKFDYRYRQYGRYLPWGPTRTICTKRSECATFGPWCGSRDMVVCNSQHKSASSSS